MRDNSFQIVWSGVEYNNIHTGVRRDDYNNCGHQKAGNDTERYRNYVSCGLSARRICTYLILLYNIWLYGKQT